MASEAAPARGGRRVNARLIVAAAAALVVLAWLGWQLREQRAAAGRVTGSGSIEATQVDVTPKVAGRVSKLLVKEGDRVRAGQALAQLEPQEAGAQVAQAQAAAAQAEASVTQAQKAVTTQDEVTRAQVAQAQAQVTMAAARVPQAETALAIEERTSQQAISAAQAQVDSTQAQVGSARSALAKARSDLARQKALLAQGAVAANEVDAAQAAYDSAAAQNRSAVEAVAQARANLASAQASLMQVQVLRKGVEAARANVAQAEAVLENAQSGQTVVAQRRQDLAAAQAALVQARANLRYQQLIAGHDTILAPQDGVIQTKNVEAGEVVPAGAALYTLLTPQDMWVRIYVREDRVGRVKIGQAARVTVDTLPGRVFSGHVTQINSRPEFTTVNVQTKEDRVKLVFGVKIHLDNRDRLLEAGMPAHAEIVVDDEHGPGVRARSPSAHLPAHPSFVGS
jgi:multidrug resistance efflux pump